MIAAPKYVTLTRQAQMKRIVMTFDDNVIGNDLDINK
jgi:hypothetical protein